MSIGEEQTECPLCMEPLEMDDINFFPCTCGYQICRFCWHRIRTDENGLCPACRKQYPEDPAEFKPLTEDELQRIKKERRQKDLQRKQKAAENRKHLANVRVVQKNLVFVVGLSQRLADPEVLKKAEYFGKFGKIHKVVINHSTSYAGAQGPSASAYVTYNRPEDALRAIQAVNNIYVDGRTLKASLGTTKYCSHFLRGAQCPKPDCMYLHELGEEAASFTKEEMQQGKHQEYEQKLYEQYMNSQNLTNHVINSSTPPATTTSTADSPTPKSNQPRKKTSSPQMIQGGGLEGENPPPSTSKEAWPSLNPGSERAERLTNGNKACTSSEVLPPLPSPSPPQTVQHNGNNKIDNSSTSQPPSQNTTHNRAPGHHRSKSNSEHEQQNGKSKVQTQLQQQQQGTTQNNRGPHLQQQQQQQQQQQHNSQHNGQQQQQQQQIQQKIQQQQQSSQPQQIHQLAQQFQNSVTTGQHSPLSTTRASPFDTGINSMSLFSNNGFSRNPKPHLQLHTEGIPTTEIPDTIPVSSTTDWQAAFGFTPASITPQTQQNTTSSDLHDDDLDLGFDPWDESSRALQDLIAKESINLYQNAGNLVAPPPGHSHHQMAPQALQPDGSRPKNLPPGFSPNHIGAYNGNVPSMGFSGSKMMGLMQFATGPPPSAHPHNTYHDVLSDISLSSTTGKDPQQNAAPQTNVFNAKDWQDGLRALLPNINISFGPQSGGNPGNLMNNVPSNSTLSHSHSATKNWSSQTPPDLSWDPAIVTSGNITEHNGLSEEPPHWMASLQHLTEENTNHRLPFLQQQFPFRAAPTWGPQAQHPPPGFQQNAIQSPTQLPEAQALATEGLQ